MENPLSEKDSLESNNLNELKGESQKWVDNYGNEIEQVFGFNSNAELVNGRLAMFGFLMLVLTEIAFKGEPALKAIFGLT